jgi:6-phosphogluconolactonase
MLKIEVLADADAVATQAARWIAEAARAAIASRGRFCLAVSGGRTPWMMLRSLADESVPWSDVHLFQVDERVTSAGDPDRNLTHLKASLLERVPLPPQQVHAMPVEAADLAAGARQYERTLRAVTGDPAVLDVVHLGLGADGHTASLVPDDAALQVAEADVADTSSYMGHRRMTLTYPLLNRARRVLWLVTGRDKAPMFARLRAGDLSIPAGRVRQDRGLVFADRAAAGAE